MADDPRASSNPGEAAPSAVSSPGTPGSTPESEPVSPGFPRAGEPERVVEATPGDRPGLVWASQQRPSTPPDRRAAWSSDSWRQPRSWDQPEWKGPPPPPEPGPWAPPPPWGVPGAWGAPWPYQGPWPQGVPPTPAPGWGPGWPPQAAWPPAPPPAAWPQPAWPQPGSPQPGWPQPGWPQPGWPQPAWPQPAWTPASPPQPAQLSAWAAGAVPWGYNDPPQLPPVVEAPGRFHPPHAARRILSLARRAAPRRYVVGLVVGLPAGLLLLAYAIGIRSGFELSAAPVAPWVVVEAVSAVAALGLIAGAAAQASQRRADGWRDFTGPSPFLLGAAQQATVLALALPIAALLTSLEVDPDSATGLAVLVPAYLVSYFGLVHLLGVRTGAMTWRDILHPRHLAPDIDDWTDARLAVERGSRRAASRLRGWLRGPLGDFLLAIALVLPVLFATGLMNLALVAVLRLDSSELQSEVPLYRSLTDQILVFLAVAVLLPIGEEVFFRGYCTNAWGRSLSPTSALLRAALFFAFVHVANTQNTDLLTSLRAGAFNFGARVPVALALTWLYMRRRSLVASASLHGAYNGLIVLITFIPFPNSPYS